MHLNGWLILMSCGIAAIGCNDAPPVRQTEAPATGHGIALAPANVAAPTSQPAGHEIEAGDLHNVHGLTPSIFCGSVPDTDESFKALAAMGIRTVLSVDGSKPCVDLAGKYGLRYVHLPFGYDGIPRRREIEIIRAVRDLPGPFYIHCHHGLHRGPTAAVIAAEALAGWTPDQAVAALRQIGTSPHYAGLYAAVRDFRPPTAEQLAQADASFPSSAKLHDLTDTMVEIDHRWDRLKAIQKNRWTVPNRAGGADASEAALLLRELFHEAGRPGGAAHDRPAQFQIWLGEAQASTANLESALRANDLNRADLAASHLQNSCAACHKTYRDPALREEAMAR